MGAVLESSMIALLQRFLKNRSGATAIEYALIVGLISIVILTGVTALGSKTNTQFQKIGNAMN